MSAFRSIKAGLLMNIDLSRYLKKLTRKEKIKLLVIKTSNLLTGKLLALLFYSRLLVKRVLTRTLSQHLFFQFLKVWMIVKSLWSKQKFSTRVYLKPGLNSETFIKSINALDIEYVLLRWFEKWPHIDPQEDLDILVADKHLEDIRSFCVCYDNGCQKLDVYSETGISNSGYYGASYFPDNLAQNILSTRKLINNVFVPTGLNYFLSLAFHAVFHKGQDSGLPYSKDQNDKRESDHDYEDLLTKLAKDLKINCPRITFSDLYNFINDNGFLPGLDTSSLYARYNPWLLNIIINNDNNDVALPVDGDVIVVVVRDWAAKNNKIDLILELINDEKLHVIDHILLDDQAAQTAKTKIRGGQWDAGPYPKSGGNPHSLIICFDYAPKPPSQQTSDTYPFVTNENIFIKHRIRDRINSEQFLWNRVNCIHSSDNEDEAYQYISILGERQMDNIHNKVCQIRQSAYFKTWDVKDVFVENGTRAKTCLINHNGQDAVLKVFRPEAKRFFEREKFVYKNFSAQLPCLAQVFEIGENYVINAFYENILINKPEKERQEIIKKHSFGILSFLKTFYDYGYAVLGFYPGNIIITPDDKLIIIDFEFLHSYEVKPEKFALSYDLVGVPKGFQGDMPRGDSNHTLENTWDGYLDTKILYNFLSDT